MVSNQLDRTDSFELRACGPITTPLTEGRYWNHSYTLLNDFTTRELDILMLLASESYSKNSEAEISFQGIKTKLDLHQQKLTIALKRLLSREVVQKTANGYKISKKGLKIISLILQSPRNSAHSNPTEYPGLEFSIPIHVEQANIFNAFSLLTGRWFSHWRWIGRFQNQHSLKMEWQSLSGTLEACLCISGRNLRIAIFDKNSSLSAPPLETLRKELDLFLQKIQKITNFKLDQQEFASLIKIKTPSGCNPLEMSHWLSNYA